MAGRVDHEDGMASLAAFLRIAGGPKLAALHLCISGSSSMVAGTRLPEQLEVLLAGKRSTADHFEVRVRAPL